MIDFALLRKGAAMTVITISRGSASGGLLLAEALSERLGYEVVSREDVVHEAARFGVTEQALQEAMVQPPGFWERFRDQRRDYLVFVQAVLCERAAKDRIIYHGNAGHFLLRGVSHVLCVRLIAPMPLRLKMLMERTKMNEAEAVRHIEETDRKREKWTRFLYGVDWLDPTFYDLTINLKTLDVAGAVDVVAAAAGRPAFQPTDESRQAMKDLLLASQVRVALARDPATAGTGIEVEAREGAVYLKGRLRLLSQVKAAIEIAGRVQGVVRVDRDQLDSPEYTV
jgi:cytidylate kinase